MKSVKNIVCLLFFLTMLLSVTAVLSSSAEHNHTYSELYTVRPTCTERGYTVFSCACGDAYEADYVKALGHNYSKDVVCYKEATCIEKGEAGRYCVRCYAKTDVIYYDKTPHTPISTVVKATDKKNGEIRKECSYCKKFYSTKVINKITSVKLDTKVYTYDGKVKTPAVAVKDSKGKKLALNKDYSLEYQKGRKKTGIYSVKVKFKGNYKGEKTLYFKIRPTAVKGVSATPSLTSVYLTWNKSKGADGYEIYLKSNKLKLIKDTDKLYYTVNKIEGKKLKNGTDYTFVIKAYKKADETKIYSSEKTVKVTTKPKKSTVKKISSSSGKVTVESSKLNCHGYEFLLSTNKSFSNAKSFKTKGKNSNSCKFEKLSRGKTHYVKVRAYVTSGGEKYYGYYSDVKSFRA